MVRAEQEMPPVTEQIKPGRERETPRGIVAALGDAGLGVSLQSIEIAIDDVIDYAGNRVRAIDRRAAADFSLEIARRQNAAIDAPMLSFGMLSANYGPSYSYDLKLSDQANNPTEPKLAEAKPVRAASPLMTTRTSFMGD